MALDKSFVNSKKLVRRKRVILSVEALQKHGKTNFLLTAPGPIALVNLDEGLEGVVEKFENEKEIQVADFGYRDATNQKEWIEVLEAVKRSILSTITDKNIKTIGIDTGTELWELLRMARFGKISSPGQNIGYWYGPVNTEFKDLISKVRNSDKNLIITHRLGAEYINDKKTGGYERKGFGDIAYMVQCNVRLSRVITKDKSGSIIDKEWRMQVLDCRQNPEIAGEELVDDMVNFPMLASMIYPDTSPLDWE